MPGFNHAAEGPVIAFIWTETRGQGDGRRGGNRGLEVSAMVIGGG